LGVVGPGLVAPAGGCDIDGTGPGRLGAGNTVVVEEGIGEIALAAAALLPHDAQPGRDADEGITAP
jgi:hypothetical protein